MIDLEVEEENPKTSFLEREPAQMTRADNDPCAAATHSQPTSHPRSSSETLIAGVRIGNLVGMRDEGCTPLIIYPGQPGRAALPARATLDLVGTHIGRAVVLLFEDGDPTLPIIVGCLPHRESWPTKELPGQVDVEADGERLVVRASKQLVLKCGKASITLTKAGKVLIKGEYVDTCSTGVNRIKGGSVQIN